VDALRGRLAGQRLRVLVAGEAKRGKTTLVNALFSRPLIPSPSARFSSSSGVSAARRGDPAVASEASIAA
jgi:septin family protein